MIVYFDMDGVLTCLDELIEELRLDGEERGQAITRICEERGHSWLFENAPVSPKIEDFKTLMRELVAGGHKVEILTSLGLPSEDHPGVPGRVEGKKSWLGKYLSNELIDKVITKVNMVHSCELKGELGGSNSILIDDQLVPNIELFRKNRGIGIHYNANFHDKCIEELWEVL